MGAVLKGRDADLGRDLAVKVLLEEHRDKPELVRRFVEEAQIGGQLQHPGIVPVYELGHLRRPPALLRHEAGQGPDAGRSCSSERPSPGDDLPRFLGDLRAGGQTVAYAHARGVIHRDLKPSNVMVGSFGEVQVMDWGLAKVLPRGGRRRRRDGGPGSPVEETVIATARSGSDADLSQAGSGAGHAVLHGARAGPRRDRGGRRAGRRVRAWARSSARS